MNHLWLFKGHHLLRYYNPVCFLTSCFHKVHTKNTIPDPLQNWSCHFSKNFHHHESVCVAYFCNSSAGCPGCLSCSWPFYTHTHTLIHVLKLTTLIFASYNSCTINHILDGLLYILDLQVFVHTHRDHRLLPDGELCGHVLLLAGCQCGLYTCSLLAVLIPCSILSPDELVPVSCH